MANASTATRILDTAQLLVQTRGYNGFSFTDVATTVGIKDASVHYHFPSKADLGCALTRRYRERFAQRLAAIDAANLDAVRKLERYVALYRDVVGADGRVCLCGALSGEFLTLPEIVQDEVRAFFHENEAWLAHTLEVGQAAGEVSFTGAAQLEAQTLLGGLEGGMLLARSFGDPTRFELVALRLLAALSPIFPASSTEQSA